MKGLFKLFVLAHVALFRATGGRLGSKMMGQNVVLLTTTGRKTGKRRTVPLMIFEDGGRHFVIGSAAGSPEHPAWYKNLQQTPQVTVELPGERYEAQARTLPSGEERGRIWQKVVASSPNFGEYEKKTAGREIPVIELVRA